LKPWEKPEIQKQSRSREPTEGASLNATVNHTSDKLIVYHTGLPTSIHTTGNNPSPEPRASAAEEPNHDTIRTEYHPKSGRKLKFEQFRGPSPADIPPPPNTSSKAPWTPFKSRADFEFAEIALQAALNQNQVDRLLKIFERCASGKDKLNLKNNKEIREIWSDASALISTVRRYFISLCSLMDTLQFTRHELTGKNNQYEMVFDFWCRPLWEWVLDLVCNSLLAPYFEWDAQRLYKFNGKVFVQFFDEPWTAKRFWEVQVCRFSSKNLFVSQTFQNTLPVGAKPIGIILYADKTKLSSFGTQMGYPIVARLANLPTEIRNGRGLGGGSVVGWLPIVCTFFSMLMLQIFTYC
jgi:hypothetical protein